MPTKPFLFTLQQQLPPDAFPWVVAALMHDPLVWEALHSGVGEHALESLGATPTAWHPGALARLALEHAPQQENTPSENPPLPPRTLADAARLALTLQAFRKDNGSWKGLAEFLEGPSTAWRTPLACALSWADDAPALLEAIAALPHGPALALHALLCQPTPPEIQAVRLAEFLRRLPPEPRLSTAWDLQRCRPALARAVAAQITTQPLPAPYDGWQRALHAAATGQPDEAQAALADAWENLRRLSGLLATHQAQLAASQGDLPTALTAWEQAATHLPSHPEVLARRALARHRARHTDEARALLPETPHHPALQVAAAHLLQNSHPETARAYALEALAHLSDLPADLLHTLAETLTALGESAAAARAALRLAAAHPADVQALDLAAETALQAQHPAEAAEAAFLAHRLAPTTARLRRLAEAQEAAGLLHEALQNHRLLAEDPEATPEDHLALASLALRADQPEEARRAAETVLEHAPEHPQALTIVGKVLAQEGHLEAARRHLEEAIAHHPTDASPYLALADVVAQTEGEAAVLDVLQTATHALPHDAEIHYRLGQYLLSQNRPGHARTVLETAHHLAPQRADIAATLAATYLALGEPTAARDLLHRYHRDTPTPKTARLLAQAHLAADDPHAAAALLAPFSQQPDATPHDLYLYAQALLAAQTDPERAAHALQLALSRLPQETTVPEDALLRADILTALAQAHRQQQNLDEALEAYRQALQALPGEHPHRQRAIAIGLAETALRLRRAEIGLAAIEDALQHGPTPRLRQLQAEAYRQLNFRDQAIDAGSDALRLSRHDPEIAHWYARLLLDLGEAPRAADVLESNTALQPHNPEIALLLAKIHHALGQAQEAISALQPFLQDLDHTTPAWCAEAGTQLLALGQTEAAVRCLQRATHDKDAPAQWHLALVRALQDQDAFEAATQAALHALKQTEGQHAPEADEGETEARIALHLAIVQNDLAQGRPQRAAQALSRALEAYPRAFSLLKAAVGLWRAIGNLPKALQAAEEALVLHPEDLPLRLEALALARVLLQAERAQHLLQASPTVATAEHLAEWLAAQAEAALDQGAEVAAAEAIAQGLEYAPESPHLLALQARLTARRVDLAEGQHLLDAAVEHAPAPTGEALPPTATLTAWAAIADAAAELRRWHIAHLFTDHVTEACPHSPAAALRKARLLTLQAESYHRCRAVEAVAALPDAQVLGATAQEAWQTALETAAQRLGAEATPEGYHQHPALHRWYARGMAAFQGRLNVLLLQTPPAPSDLAAGLDALRRRGMPMQNALPAFQNDPMVQFHHALLLESLPTGDLQIALQAAQHARDQRPQWAAAHFLVARLANRLSDLPTAEEAITAALRLAPDEPCWHALAAAIHTDLRHEEQALHHLQEAVRLEPQHLSHHLALAEAEMARGDLEAAHSALTTALRHHPEHARPHLLLAQVLFRLGRLDEAAQHAETAARAERHAAEPVMLRIQIALAQQAPEIALQHARRWLQSHPFDPEATRYAVNALLALGEAEEALRLLEETLPHAPDDMELNILRAELHRQIGGPKAAVEIWRGLLASRPNVPTLWLGLAEALAASRQLDAARAAGRKALRGMDTLPPESRVRLHMLLGNLAKEAGQLDQALYHFSEAVRLAPKHIEALLKLAQVQSDRREYAAALQTLEAAQRLDPQDSRPYYYAGMIYKAVRDYENAEDMFRKAAQLAPGDFRIRRQLATVSVINLIPS
ncbi:MAG TPA: tetratricopeptide repeat protein [Chloroflexi bacterium]|nr:tetratricopeptide repeat protein [Chloroflexota bacterium]